MSNSNEEKLVSEFRSSSPVPYPFKKVVFALAAISSFYLGTFTTALTPVSGAVSTLFDIPTSRVLLTSSLFLGGNVTLAPFVFPIMKSRGLRFTYIIASCLFSIGGLLRLLFEEGFEAVLAGQFFVGMGASLIINTQMEFCNTWFNVEERPMYLSIISIANIFGGGFGNTIPLLFVDDSETDRTKLLPQFYFYMKFSALLLLILTALTTLLFEDQPPKESRCSTPAIETAEERSMGFLALSSHYIRDVCRYPSFVCLLCLYMCGNSNLVLLGTIVNEVTKSFGYSSIFGSLGAFIVIFFGLTSAIAYSIRYMKYRVQSHRISILIFGTIFSMFVSIFCLQFSFSVGYLIVVAVFGMFSFPLIPVSMELITRKFPQVPTYLTNTIIVFSSQMFTILIQFGASATGLSSNAGVMTVIILVNYFFCFFFARKIDD